MRASLRRDRIELVPGTPVKVQIEVTNTLEVIDGVTASIATSPGMTATSAPGLLPLFPEGTGQLTVELAASATFPCGSYDIPVELRSSAVPGEGLVDHVAVVVPPQPAGELTVLPPVRSGRKTGRYTVVCENTGNTTLDLALAASDPERACLVRFAAPTLTVEPGGSATTEMAVRCRRRILGTEISRAVTVLAEATGLELETKAVFRHRPLIPRGARTVVVLGMIIAAWAAVFVFALNKALGSDPLTKQVPASFYAALGNKATASQLSGLDGGVDLASADGSAPAGAVPKTGVVVGVGGTIAGTVEAKSTLAGVGRITVQAYQAAPGGPKLVASAATGSDGTYSIVGLLPGPYRLSFTAQGYDPLWYPSASAESGAAPVAVDALATTGGINATLTGLPGSITGTVETGQTPAPPVTVTVLPQQGASTKPIATVVSNQSGTYSIPDLPSPGSYDLSFSSPGYNPATDTEQLDGGEARIANTVTMTAAPGSISGTVTSAGQALGGVVITAKSNGQTYTSATPTSGDIGAFTIDNLPSPATYLMTFSETGYGSKTVGEALGPGQALTGLKIDLSGGAGTISGEVVSSSGSALGGATVTVYDGSKSSTTATLTAGQVGSFTVSGLTTPGNYTLTFSLAGYISQTIAVPLGSSGSASNIDVTLPSAAGTITGTVVSSQRGNVALSGVSVSLTDGSTVMTTTSASQLPAGGFSFSGLASGTYTLTFSLTGYADETYLVKLKPGQTSALTAVLAPAS